MKETERSAGKHLIIDALVENPELLENIPFLHETFIKLVEILSMTILQYPNFLFVPKNEELVGQDDDEGGVSGFCMITTSHLSIHTWPLRGRFSMDIFSCKDFDAGKALKFVSEAFRTVSVSSTIVERTWPS